MSGPLTSIAGWGPSEETAPAVESPILQGSPKTSSVTDSHHPTPRDESQEEHEEHIAKLAQPKKAFPGGPARLQQKKKTVAFGQTVNVSQCIVGKALKARQTPLTRSGKTTMRNGEENKENGAPVENSNRATGGVQKKVAAQKPVVTDGSDTMTELKDIVLKLAAKMDNIEQKVDGLEHDKMKVVPAPTNNFHTDTGSRQQMPSGSRLSDNERRMLEELGPMLRNNPNFLKSVADLCKDVQKAPPRDDYVPDRGYGRQQRPAQYSSNNRNSVLTEQVFVQRSIQQPLSPNGSPYSTESFNFIKRHSIPPRDGNAPVSTYESMAYGTSRRSRDRPGLVSNYHSGYSRSYNNQPNSVYQDEYESDEQPIVEDFDDLDDVEPYCNSPRCDRMDMSDMDLRQQERRDRWKR